MTGRLEGKSAIVVGAGQTPGDTIGNGKAISILFAREGARVLCVDRELSRAQATVEEIEREGGAAFAYKADIRQALECAAIGAEAQKRFGRIDILVNNVGMGGGDKPPHLIEEDAWDLIMDVNLKGMAMTIRHVLPVMRGQHDGAIVNISSLASLAGHHMVAYEVSKAGVNRLTLSVASSAAKYGVRCNAVLPGLMDTPMAIGGTAAASGRSEAEMREIRSGRVPLRGQMGTAWDTAYAALFLASEEARFITGALLPVDGGMSARVG